MKIKYRPHRGSLKESMSLEKEFNSIEEMFEFIVNDTFKNAKLYEVSDLSIGENLGKDDRINWRETRYVLTKRCGMLTYSTPQCIGMCSFETEEDK